MVLISFSHFLVSIPFSFFKVTHMGGDDIKAYWQPPDIVFEVIWPILYVLLGIICVCAFAYKKLSNSCKVQIIKHSIYEAIGQAFWLISFVKYTNNIATFDRYKIQYFISTTIILTLVLYAWCVRMPTLIRCSKKVGILYLPYLLWISFAAILNIQILHVALNIRWDT